MIAAWPQSLFTLTCLIMQTCMPDYNYINGFSIVHIKSFFNFDCFLIESGPCVRDGVEI